MEETMANPKRRHSKTRRDKRRANWKLEQPDLSVCPQCKEPKLPHHVCLNCGYYNGKKIVKTKQEKKETKAKKEKKD
jgi:large subunit ribosomal protein L32